MFSRLYLYLVRCLPKGQEPPSLASQLKGPAVATISLAAQPWLCRVNYPMLVTASCTTMAALRDTPATSRVAVRAQWPLGQLAASTG